MQNIKLLGGMAPTCSVEQLIYDCRLMNQALAGGEEAALLLRSWMIRSDAALDAQAYILSPESAIKIATAIVKAPGPDEAGRGAGLAAIHILRSAHQEGRIKISPREMPWLDRMQQTLEALPVREDQFISEMMAELDTSRFIPQDYEI